jgi:molybdate-binding protein/DNA-binding XRE family transcriptional regulator
MSRHEAPSNRIKQHRALRGWSQGELARRAGLSRAEISAIEIQRVVPSVAAALSLAAALECRVEDLFGANPSNESEVAWAWPPLTDSCRFWQAEVNGRTLRYPAETTGAGVVGHDGVVRHGEDSLNPQFAGNRTLVMACCDPAAALLAAELARTGAIRLLVLARSSRSALDLLGKGVVHLAGVHLSHGKSKDNATAVRTQLGPGYRLLHVARWVEGLALRPGLARESLRSLVGSKLNWVGREPGSGARDCLDEILEGRPAPKRLASDHRGVAEAIRSGWADAGVCLQLVSEESGLDFLSVREESYELCCRDDFEGDPRFRALLQALRSPGYRQILGELPGYDVSSTGELRSVE